MNGHLLFSQVRGIVFVLRPQGQGAGAGEISALAGAVLLALAMMTVRWLGATEPMARVLFYYFLLSTVLAVPFAILDWRPLPPAGWGWLVALGVAQLSSQALIVLAYRYAAAEKVGPFIYSVIVFTALIDWIVWHHPTDGGRVCRHDAGDRRWAGRRAGQVPHAAARHRGRLLWLAVRTS